MENKDILESWREPIKCAVIKTFLRFKEDPKIILTESDLKCNLYLDLIKLKAENEYENEYAVHTEVTHYIGERNEQNRRLYRFRDMSLLCPWLVEENANFWDTDIIGLSKGFRHIGPAFHLELKIKRQAINEHDNSEITTADIENLNGLNFHKDREKRFAIVWISRDPNYLVGDMENQAKEAIEALNKDKKDLIDVYLIDSANCKRLYFVKGQLTYEKIG